MNSRIVQELTAIKNTIAKDLSILNAKEIIARLNTITSQPSINLESILSLISVIQENIDATDYLKRKNTDTPLADKPIQIEAIPTIHKILKQLIDLFIAAKEQQLRNSDIKSIVTDPMLMRCSTNVHDMLKNMSRHLDEFSQLSAEQKEKIIDNIIVSSIGKLKEYIILGTNNIPNDIAFWMEHYHYCTYPRDKFKENRNMLDRIEIYMILSHQHYSNLPLEKIIQLQHSGTTDQPNFVEIKIDETIQYDAYTKTCHQLETDDIEITVIDRNGKFNPALFRNCLPSNFNITSLTIINLNKDNPEADRYG